MHQHPYVFMAAIFLVGGFCGYAWGWNRACWYRDRLETKFPRTRA